MSIGTQSQTSSQLLDSSVSSLRRPKKSNSEISKTYKHASQLYLTRRLAECYEALQPVIRPASKPENQNGHISTSEDDTLPRAPVASASTSQRIKIWSLYATLLNTIVELDDEEGKQDFGNKLYREIVRNVQSGEVWEQVVRDGYMGREASVDAEVVYNLSNLLLGQAPHQTINQSRLETYLSSSPHGSIDFSAAFDGNSSSMHTKNGMDTPKDLNSRIKILELFTLHVLPRNGEWEYARSFITNSDILDEERREAFSQTLNELQEAKEQEEAQAQAEAAEDLVGFAEETEDELTDTNGDKIQMNDEGEPVQGKDHDHINGDSSHSPKRKSGHRRISSEVDYGIDDDLLKARSPQPSTQKLSPSQPQPSVTAKQPSPTPATPSPATISASHTAISPSPAHPAPTPKPSTTPARKPPSNNSNKANTNKNTNKNTNTSKSTLSKFLLVITNLTRTIAGSLTKNPTQVFRTIMFLFAFLAVLVRKDVRDRLRRIIGVGWEKMRDTAGMGVRVSYV